MRGLLATLAVLLAGCSGSPQVPTSGPTARPIEYAALGDSYTAAPYVVATDLAGGCLRSQANYPKLLAKTLGAELTDVSCGGASTANVMHRQRPFGDSVVPPQIEAVSARTRLVTIGLGGNDSNLFASLVKGCPMTDREGEQMLSSGECGHVDLAKATRLLQGTRRHLVDVITTVERKAPDARIVVVGYSRLMGERACGELPISRANQANARRVAVLLRDAQLAAARATGADFIDMHRLSAGHDACAKTPWVRGVHTDQRQGAAMHPTPAGQIAVAEAIADHLRDVGF